MNYCRLLLGLVSLIYSLSVTADGNQTVAADKEPLHVVFPLVGDTPDSGPEHPLMNVVRSWAQLIGREIEIERVPFKRSLLMATNGEADLHFPMIRPHHARDGNPYTYSSAPLLTVNFVVYSRKGENIDLTQPQRYRIATHSGHKHLFPFAIAEEHTIEGSLRKLDNYRLDAFIFADSAADPILYGLGLSGLQRKLYTTFNVHAVIPAGEKGGMADKIISNIAQQMPEETLRLAGVGQPYNDWQVGDADVPALVQNSK
ncbi:hypothetical protein [Thalassolituus maritimus]